MAARDLLLDQLRRLIDSEMLNDAAVLAMRCGDLDEAKDLLRALVHLHPSYPEAARNLAALDAPDC